MVAKNIAPALYAEEFSSLSCVCFVAMPDKAWVAETRKAACTHIIYYNFVSRSNSTCEPLQRSRSTSAYINLYTHLSKIFGAFTFVPLARECEREKIMGAERRAREPRPSLEFTSNSFQIHQHRIIKS